MDILDVGCNSDDEGSREQQQQDGREVVDRVADSCLAVVATGGRSSSKGASEGIQGGGPADDTRAEATLSSHNDNHHLGASPVCRQRRQQQNLSPYKAALAFALSSTIMFGLYYLIAMPASVRKHIQEVMPPDDHNFEVKFQLLFTLSGLPGMILPLFAGAVVDKVGARYCLLILSFMCFIGQVTSAVGVTNESWPITLVGRFVYGLGFENLFVSNQAFLTSCFTGKQLGMALGISGAASYAGLLVCPILSPIAANKVSTAFSFWLGVIIIGISVLAALFIFVAFRGSICDVTNSGPSTMRQRASSTSRAKRSTAFSETVAHKQKEPHDREDTTDRLHSHEELVEENGRTVQLEASDEERRGVFYNLRFIWSVVISFSLSFWLLSASCLLDYTTTQSFLYTASGILLERSLFVEPPRDCALQYPDQCSSGYSAPTSGNPSIDPRGKACPVGDEYAPVIPSSLNITKGDSSWDKQRYIFSSLETTDVDCTDEFWSGACTYTYCEREEEQTDRAGILMSITYIVAVFTTFPFGKFGVDRLGLRAEMVTFAPVLLTVAHSLLAYLRISPIMPLVIMGLGQSIAIASIWPSVPIVVPEGCAGLAFGVMTCIQNVGLTLFPLIVAAIYNATNHQYIPAVGILFMWCSVLAILVGVALVYWDRKNGGKLRVRGIGQ